MMDKLRDFIKSWPGRILMLLCLAPMAFLGLESYLHQGALTPNQVAKVGDSPIDLANLQSEANTTRVRLLETVDASLINEDALMAQTLETMINRALLEEQATHLGMKVSDQAITLMLQNNPTFADADGNFSNDLFANYLQREGLSKDALFASQRRQINLRSLMNGILSTAIYTTPQVNRLIGLQSETRQLWLKRLSWQNYADQVQIGDDELQAYYNEHQAVLKSPDRVDLSYIELSADDIKLPEVTQEELAAAYQAHLRENNLGQRQLAQILLTGDDVATQIKKIQSALTAGESFEDLAKQYSSDPSGQSGGVIGAYNPAVFGADASQVDVALAPLSQGQVSEPVVTSFGTHFFKVVGMSEAPTLDSLKSQLTTQIEAQKRQALFGEKVATINGMVADGFGLKDIADELHLTIKQLPNYQRENQTVMGQPAIVKAAFDDFTIQDGSVSSNIDLLGTTLWLQPGNFRPATLMSFEEAKSQIKAELTKQKASKLALADAQKYAKNIDKEALATLTSVGMANRQTAVLTESERASLFMHPANKEAVVGWAVATDMGATIMAGGEIQNITETTLSDVERVGVANMMKGVSGQDHLEDYLHYLRSVHSVQMNDDVLNSL